MRNKLRRDIIKQRFIEEIQSSNIPLNEIAIRVGIHPSMMTDYKNTNKMPSIETFSKICEVIGADANYILGLTDE